MDSLIAAAARALATGDPLGALGRVALREDPPALALRGIAMAQLGELERAEKLLRRAARAFGSGAPLARARCITAQAEIALAARELARPTRGLDAAIHTLEAHGDHANAAHARLLSIRHALLLGSIAEAERALAEIDLGALPPMSSAIGELVTAQIGIRRLRTRAAREALDRAREAARRARIAALGAEVERARETLSVPAARLISSDTERALLLEEVEALFESSDLVVDACRRAVHGGGQTVPLARRPVLFALVRALGEAWPAAVPRSELIARAFSARRANDSHRARLRVELGRLRRALSGLADVIAASDGYGIAPRGSARIVVLAPPIDGADAAVLALLADGQAWSTSALALALGSSQRTVQRALTELEARGRARSHGRARAQRWLAAPLPGITTTLLLPPPPVLG